MSTIQSKFQALLDRFVTEGRERGMQLTVYHHGQLVVDAFAGHVDPQRSTPVTADSLFPVFSVTKGILTTAAHRAVERGLIDYDTPLAHVWPEFAAHGKGAITLRHALTHTAGLQLLPAGLTAEHLHGWDTMCRVVADATPVAPPGETQAYHAVTFGYLVGEAIRRVDGRPIDRIVREDICEPLGLRDLHIGLPETLDARVATLEHPDAPPPPTDDVPRDVPQFMWPLHTWMNRPATRLAVIPASNGIATARAIARHYAALCPGGVDGVQLITDRTRELATHVSRPTPEHDGIGLGWMAARLHAPDLQFGHGGFGGSRGFAIPNYRIAVGLTRNLLKSNPLALDNDLFAAIKRELGVAAT